MNNENPNGINNKQNNLHNFVYFNKSQMTNGTSNLQFKNQNSNVYYRNQNFLNFKKYNNNTFDKNQNNNNNSQKNPIKIKGSILNNNRIINNNQKNIDSNNNPYNILKNNFDQKFNHKTFIRNSNIQRNLYNNNNDRNNHFNQNQFDNILNKKQFDNPKKNNFQINVTNNGKNKGFDFQNKKQDEKKINKINLKNIDNNDPQQNKEGKIDNNIKDNVKKDEIRYIPKKHIPKLADSYLCSVRRTSEAIDINETNSIINIVQLNYSTYSKDNKKTLSTLISENIKNKLGGEWFIFVSKKNDKISLNFTTVSESDYLIIDIAKSQFKIAKTK